MREADRGRRARDVRAGARPPAFLRALRAQAQGPGAPDRLQGAMRPLPHVAPELRRFLREVESAQSPRVTLDGRDVLLLCSNDYLGLAGDPRVAEAAGEAARRWGAGAGSSQLVSGHMRIHSELEERLA